MLLSATIGDMQIARKYLAPDAAESVLVAEHSNQERELKLRVHCYVGDPPPDHGVPDEEPPDAAFDRLADDIVKHCRGEANLVFANSRADVELLADACRTRGQALGITDQFLVHHGSLSAEIRRDAEATMKAGAVATTFCTPTLELGVDIGSVKMVGQVDPPWSVASLKQRLGRSGRRAGESQILRMYVRSEGVHAKSDLFDRMHLDLVRALATTELLLSGWVEPPRPAQCALSTLTHQIISVIGECGGCSAKTIHQRLCVSGPFRDVELALFTRLLRQLAKGEIIEQMPEGDLILGPMGERIYRHFTFYAVFQTPETFTLIYGSEHLGTMDVVPEINQHVVFAARRWRVTDVNMERKEIQVVPARGRRRTQFGGRAGMLHGHIVEKMRELLLSEEVPAYLDEEGRTMLTHSRATARASGCATKRTISLGPNQSCLLTWAGTRVQRTLAAMMILLDVHPVDCHIGLGLPMAEDQVSGFVSKLLRRSFDPEHLALAVQDSLPSSKFDWIIGPEFVAVHQSRQFIDLPAAQCALRHAVPT